MLTSWIRCSIWCWWGIWFERLGEIPLWTSIVWPSGEYTYILDEGNISAWCCRMQVVNYRWVIYDWIKNGGKDNIRQDVFSSVPIWITHQLRSPYTRFWGNRRIYIYIYFGDCASERSCRASCQIVYNYSTCGYTTFFFTFFFFKINFLFYKSNGWIMILCVLLCIALVVVNE